MKIYFLMLVGLFLLSCKQSVKTSHGKEVRVNDTIFLKKIHWDSLNKFVGYDIFRNGHFASDSMYHFSMKLIAIYHYLGKSWEEVNSDTAFKTNPKGLKSFILSDSFANKEGFDCLLKINSNIAYRYRPDLLETIDVTPKDTSQVGVKSLMTILSKLDFVQKVGIKILPPNPLDSMLNDTNRIAFLDILLKLPFRNLSKIKTICSQLKRRPDVDDASFTNFFTDINEEEMIFRLKTEKNK